MTQDEMQELKALNDAITFYPASVVPSKMERFTELMIKSLVRDANPTGKTK